VLRELMLEADLITPDSFGVVWAAKRAGKPVEGRVSGVDLVDRICGLSARKGYRLFFLGAGPGVAELAAERLRLRHPGCNIVGTRNGFFPASDDSVVAEEVAAFRPDVLFVAMGIPRQEKFIRATQSIIRAKVAIGVGGSFDVFSGKTKRAPILIQRLNIEWLWRLLLNPKKFSKVMSLPKFALAVIRSKVGKPKA
jgi:N-acetylglucosaminyldiphosphoundecaprenol N-acetyl-beta-D-mannosaminyltransferase